MALTPYRPSTEMFGSMFEDLFRPASGIGNRVGGMIRLPDADVVERENEIRVAVELPGLTPEDIHLDIENNVLTISGEKRENRQEENETWHLTERRYGKFSRSFVLPRDVDQDQIEAHFAGGVLSVTIPKSERARRKRIEIQRGDGQQRVEARSVADQGERPVDARLGQ
jgi:HSP20 family protein